jgi:hypothetical protein
LAALAAHGLAAIGTATGAAFAPEIAMRTLPWIVVAVVMTAGLIRIGGAERESSKTRQN